MQYYLFEHINAIPYCNREATNDLENLLNGIWQKRMQSPLYNWSQWNEGNNKSLQAFISIDRQNNIKSRNYVGIIKHGNNTLHLLPKICYCTSTKVNDKYVQAIYQHLMWWMGYTFKIKAPFSQGAYNADIQGDMAEVFMYWFAKHCERVFSEQVYFDYQQISANTSHLKGHFQTTKFATKNLAKGQWHLLPCSYQTFNKDNLLNSIIKEVCSRLLWVTQHTATQNSLHNILRQLQEVSPRAISAADCDKVKLNPLFDEWEMLLNYCRMFLAGTTVLSPQSGLKMMAFLLPMEQVFEQFVYGFMKQHFTHWNITYQDASTYLAKDEQANKRFNLRQDITLKRKDNSLVIIDVKYKLLSVDRGKLKGVLPSDLYQMAAYAVRRNCREVYLIYPSAKSFEDTTNPSKTPKNYWYDIVDELSQQTIRVYILLLPIAINFESMAFHHQVSQQLQVLESDIKQVLSVIY